MLLSTTTTVMIAIVVISSVISAIGFVSTMSLTVIQRRHEIGLPRALGLTRRQVARMITLEAAALSGTAAGFGIALGVVYGSVGAQALVGVYGSVGAQALVGSMTSGFVWGLPWKVLAVIAAASVVLVLASARPQAGRAIRVTPIEARRVTLVRDGWLWRASDKAQLDGAVGTPSRCSAEHVLRAMGQ
jgi:putative ABC transport system permease protein